MSDNYLSEAELRERCRIEREHIVQKYDVGRVEGAEIDDWEDPKFEVYLKQDRYGFLRDDRSPEEEKRRELDKRQVEIERNRSVKWALMINSEAKFFASKAKEREKMINRIYKGVPDSVRGRLWYILLDIDRAKREKKGIYEQMKKLARNSSPDIRQIDLDVNRTYRNHSMFRLRYNGRQKALFHVLAAYSMYNTEVGYCQGMSQIAALLLMYLVEEEDAFWALSQLMANQKYAMHGFFIPGFPKLIRFQIHHDRIFKKFMPRLKKHFDRHGIDSGIYTLKWFFQCFLDRLPFSLTLRVWDLYLLEGERVLIAMAHNILKMHRKYLSKLGMDEIIEHIQIQLAENFGYEDDKVIESLREVMNDLRSQRLDASGKTPSEELPQKPFGIIPTSLNFVQMPIEKELGLRSGLTDLDRKYNLVKQQEAENASKDETTFTQNAYDENDAVDDLASIPEDDSMTHQNNLNGSADAQSSTHKMNGSKSPFSSSDAVEILDESMRFLLKSASDLNGVHSGQSGATTDNYYSSGGMLDASFDSTSGEVLRIYVPYTASTRETQRPDHPRYEGDKVLIKVNHSPVMQPASERVNQNSSFNSGSQNFSQSWAHLPTSVNSKFDALTPLSSPGKVLNTSTETGKRREIRSMHADSYTITPQAVHSSKSTTIMD